MELKKNIINTKTHHTYTIEHLEWRLQYHRANDTQIQCDCYQISKPWAMYWENYHQTLGAEGMENGLGPCHPGRRSRIFPWLPLQHPHIPASTRGVNQKMGASSISLALSLIWIYILKNFLQKDDCNKCCLHDLGCSICFLELTPTAQATIEEPDTLDLPQN